MSAGLEPGTSVPPARTVFLGTGGFASPILEALARSPVITLVGIVTAPPRAAGRGGKVRASPVAGRAAELGVPVLQPPRLRAPDAVAAVRGLAPELLVLADYGQIVPADLLALPDRGALNLHPSLLPRHRGAAPVPAAILAGDLQTGVTLMVMDAGLDTGPIVAQEALELTGSETAPELETELAGIAVRLLEGALPRWLAGRIRPVPQPAEGATLTRLLRREDGRLDPARSAFELERQVRAYQPWPGSFLDTPAGRIIIWRADALGLAREGGRALGGGTELAGTLLPDGDGLALAVRDGALRLREVQASGGRRLPGPEFRRGHPGVVGSRVLLPAVR